MFEINEAEASCGWKPASVAAQRTECPNLRTTCPSPGYGDASPPTILESVQADLRSSLTHHLGEEMPFEENTKPLTTAAGAPVVDNQNSMSAGPRGPLLLQDLWLIEKLAHFAREVIP